MARELKRVRLEPDTDLLRLLEDVHTDRTPRLIEREGEALAVVINPEDYAGAMAPASEATARALKAAGAWSDLNWDEMEEALDRIRHESPPSPLISL